MAQSISDKDRQFNSIPLQTQMLAEAFEEEFRSFYVPEKSEPEISHNLELLGLYERFIDRKYDVYYRKKSETVPGSAAADEQPESYMTCMPVLYQRLAL